MNKIKIIITCVYLAPNLELDDFVQSMKCLEKVLQTRCIHILVGNFNLPNINWDSMICSTDIKSCNFLDLCVNNGLRQLVNVPTRLNNILDLLLCNNELVIAELTINEPFGTSDYDSINFLVVIESEFNIPENTNNNVATDTCTMWWKADWEGFELFCLNTDWIALLGGCFEANEMWFFFIKI